MRKIIYSLIFLSCIGASCKKFLEVPDPIDKIVSDYAYNSEVSAISVVTGIYHNMQLRYAQGIDGPSMFCGVYADELVAAVNSPLYTAYMNEGGGEHFWGLVYPDVYKCNAAIEGLQKANNLSYIVRNQLLGEARFTRAFLYFYLVNFFSDIPLLTSTDYAANSKVYRSSAEKVYDQIVIDLKEAVSLLSNNYLANDVRVVSQERLRPNKAAAQALLARVYLYLKDWANAEATSSLLINDPAYEMSANLDAVFLKDSKEAIWQMDPQTADYSRIFRNTADGRYFVLDLPPDQRERPVWMSDALINSFEPGDLRYEKWVGKSSFDGTDFKYPFKYKVNKPNVQQEELLMVLRISEQYLIRAEARINNNNIPGGIEDLNLVRSVRRASPSITVPDPLPELSTSMGIDQAKLAVEQERRVELFSEWGHRWLDIKRTGKVDQIMSALNASKGTVWKSYRKLFPTPANDMILNQNLGPTPGY